MSERKNKSIRPDQLGHNRLELNDLSKLNNLSGLSDLSDLRDLSFEKALSIYEDAEISTDGLRALADRIRYDRLGNETAFCTIVNGKSGKCTEDCRFCAQSKFYDTDVTTYPMLPQEEILKAAFEAKESGVQKFSIVTSGGYLTDDLLKALLPIYEKLKSQTGLSICASHGMLTYDQAKALKAVGVDTYHHNLESSRDFYPQVCMSHDYQERIETVKACQDAGLNVCCGGIFGLGESVEDRLKLAFEIKELGVKSIPLNLLMPIAGTPMAINVPLETDEILRTLALFRLINPDAMIRIAGGRMTLGSSIEKALTGGVNALMVGNYLTTLGSKVNEDLLMMSKLGYQTSLEKTSL